MWTSGFSSGLGSGWSVMVLGLFFWGCAPSFVWALCWGLRAGVVRVLVGWFRQGVVVEVRECVTDLLLAAFAPAQQAGQRLGVPRSERGVALRRGGTQFARRRQQLQRKHQPWWRGYSSVFPLEWFAPLPSATAQRGLPSFGFTRTSRELRRFHPVP